MATNNVNHVILIGNLTKDPELKTTKSGKSVAELRLAVNSSYKKGDDWESRANYFQVSVWGKQGENADKYLGKGSKVAIDGRLEWQSWESPDGKGMNSRVVIIANNVEYLSSPKDSDSDSGPSADDVPATSSGDDDEDDIPF